MVDYLKHIISTALRFEMKRKIGQRTSVENERHYAVNIYFPPGKTFDELIAFKHFGLDAENLQVTNSLQYNLMLAILAWFEMLTSFKL